MDENIRLTKNGLKKLNNLKDLGLIGPDSFREIEQVTKEFLGHNPADLEELKEGMYQVFSPFGLWEVHKKIEESIKKGLSEQ